MIRRVQCQRCGNDERGGSCFDWKSQCDLVSVLISFRHIEGMCLPAVFWKDLVCGWRVTLARGKGKGRGQKCEMRGGWIGWEWIGRGGAEGGEGGGQVTR